MVRMGSTAPPAARSAEAAAVRAVPARCGDESGIALKSAAMSAPVAGSCRPDSGSRAAVRAGGGPPARIGFADALVAFDANMSHPLARGSERRRGVPSSPTVVLGCGWRQQQSPPHTRRCPVARRPPACAEAQRCVPSRAGVPTGGLLSAARLAPGPVAPRGFSPSPDCSDPVRSLPARPAWGRGMGQQACRQHAASWCLRYQCNTRTICRPDEATPADASTMSATPRRPPQQARAHRARSESRQNTAPGSHSRAGRPGASHPSHPSLSTFLPSARATPCGTLYEVDWKSDRCQRHFDTIGSRLLRLCFALPLTTGCCPCLCAPA